MLTRIALTALRWMCLKYPRRSKSCALREMVICQTLTSAVSIYMLADQDLSRCRDYSHIMRYEMTKQLALIFLLWVAPLTCLAKQQHGNIVLYNHCSFPLHVEGVADVTYLDT